MPAEAQGAPAGPAGNNVGAATVDSLVDGALGAMAEDAQEAQEGAEGAETAEDPGEGEEGQEDGLEDPGEGEEGEEDDRATSKGSKADPFTVKDLPEDRYIKVKIDGGKEEAVSMRELADGYIRFETFAKRVGTAATAIQQAEGTVRELQEKHGNVRTQVNQLLGDPKKLLDFYLGDSENEGIFRAAATEYAQRHAKWKANPQERAAWERDRDAGKLKKEREDFENQKRTQTEAQQRSESNARRSAELKPGWDAGLKEAGFPNVTSDFQDHVRAILSVVGARSGKPVTADDVKAAVIKTAKLLGSEPGKPKPKPAVIAPKAKREAPAKPGGKPPQRGSVEAIMMGLKPFRG